MVLPTGEDVEKSRTVISGRVGTADRGVAGGEPYRRRPARADAWRNPSATVGQRTEHLNQRRAGERPYARCDNHLGSGAITTSDPANCKPAWFSLDSNRDTFPVTIMANSSSDIGDYRLSFNETTPASDQTAYSGATITVPFLTP